MISKKTLKEYDFQVMEDYFDYIYESYVNGQIKQSKKLYANMSKKQKNDFTNWFTTSFHYDIVDNGEQGVNDAENFLSALKSTQ